LLSTQQRQNDNEQGGMTRATFTIAAVAFLCSAAAETSPPVTFESPCECRDNHGEHRWAVKNDPSTPPADASAIQAVTPSDIFSWPGPDGHLTQQSERSGIENNWYALTGRVVALKVGADGDLHIALQNATGDRPGIVVAEVPAKPGWLDRLKDRSGRVPVTPLLPSCDGDLSLLVLRLRQEAKKIYVYDNDHPSPCEVENRQNRGREVLGDYRRQSEEGRMELWLFRNCGLRRANNLDSGRASRQREASHCAGV